MHFYIHILWLFLSFFIWLFVACICIYREREREALTTTNIILKYAFVVSATVNISGKPKGHGSYIRTLVRPY